MSQAIAFKTSKFDVSKERENPINPIYGVSLLEWLRDELEGKLEITEPAAEDWGWYSLLQYEGNSYLIGASACFEEGDSPTSELEWVFQVSKIRGVKETLFGRNRMSATDNCFDFFRELFERDPDFREVEAA